MLASKRQEKILAQTGGTGQVTVAALSETLGVSAQTIRRDIQVLDEKKLLRKVHGGAVAIRGNRLEPAYAQRVEENLAEKKAIAQYAAGFIADNEVIGLDSGATMDWLCRALPAVQNLTIITASTSALAILMQRVQAGEIAPKIIFLGGEINSTSCCAQGHMPLDLLRQFSMDKCFLAATAVSADGVKMYDLYDCAFSTALLARSAQGFYLGASEKTGRQALCKVCDLKQLHHFITDNRFTMQGNIKRALKHAGVQRHIVSGQWEE